MSAKYHCNFCGRKIDYKSNSYYQHEWVSRTWHGTKNVGEVPVTMIIELHNGEHDICENCCEAVKKDAIKKFHKSKMSKKGS